MIMFDLPVATGVLPVSSGHSVVDDLQAIGVTTTYPEKPQPTPTPTPAPTPK